MEISIHRPNHDSLLRENQLRWKQYESKALALFFIYAALGLFLSVGEWITLKENKSYWSFWSAFGIGVLLLAFLTLVQIFRSRQRYLARSTALVNRLNKMGGGMDVKITDTAITYKDVETFFEVKWSAFSSYKMYKDYLFLLMNESSLNSIAIQKQEVSNEQFTELLQFIAAKLRRTS